MTDATVAGAASRTRNIEDIEVGDLVWAWEESVRGLVKRPVMRLFQHEARPILAVTIVGGNSEVQVVEATAEHPFWVEGRGWVAADELRSGDILKRIGTGSPMQVASVKRTDRKADVFNFEVDAVHNYFVGTVGLLVHNMSSDPNAHPSHQVDALAPTLRPSELVGLRSSAGVAPFGLVRSAPQGRLDLAGRAEGALSPRELGSSVRFFPLCEHPNVAVKVLRPETLRILGDRLPERLGELERGHLLFDELGLMEYYGAGVTNEGTPYLAVGLHDGFQPSGNFSVPAAHHQYMDSFRADFNQFLRRHTGSGYGDFQWGYDRKGRFRMIDPPLVKTASELNALIRGAAQDLARWIDPATGKIRL